MNKQYELNALVQDTRIMRNHMHKTEERYTDFMCLGCNAKEQHMTEKFFTYFRDVLPPVQVIERLGMAYPYEYSVTLQGINFFALGKTKLPGG